MSLYGPQRLIRHQLIKRLRVVVFLNRLQSTIIQHTAFSAAFDVGPCISISQQNEIRDQPGCTPVTIYEWMDTY